MRKFFFSSLYLALLLPLYLIWSRQQIEEQIDKMQEAVFNTPGAESPVTPPMIIGGISLLVTHIMIARRGLQLSLMAALGSMLLGGAIGILGWLQWQKGTL